MLKFVSWYLRSPPVFEQIQIKTPRINNRMRTRQGKEVILIIIMKENEEETKIHQENKHGNASGPGGRMQRCQHYKSPTKYAIPGEREADPMAL